MFDAVHPLAGSLVTLVVSGAVLIIAGVRFTRVVDRLADRLGIGEAIAGAVLLGATTSIPGLIVTGLSAYQGQASLAVSNALGGIAAQTMFLALADLTYREANLEHAAASLPNLIQTMVLVALVSVVLIAVSAPTVSLFGVHPLSLALPMIYVHGLVLTHRSRREPMWQPRQTAQTRRDELDADEGQRPARALLLPFLALGAVVALCGVAVAEAGLTLAEQSELSGTVVGALITSVVTSLPELVTVLAAVRAGALTLAIGDIIGGNCFDVLFLTVADVALREGDLYGAVGDSTVFLLGLTLAMTSCLASGLLARQRRGIGYEGIAILAIYAAGMATLAIWA